MEKTPLESSGRRIVISSLIRWVIESVQLDDKTYNVEFRGEIRVGLLGKKSLASPTNLSVLQIKLSFEARKNYFPAQFKKGQKKTFGFIGKTLRENW